MAEEVLKVTRHPNYAVLTLNRPEKRNALQSAVDASTRSTRRSVSSKTIAKSVRCSCAVKAQASARESI